MTLSWGEIIVFWLHIKLIQGLLLRNHLEVGWVNDMGRWLEDWSVGVDHVVEGHVFLLEEVSNTLFEWREIALIHVDFI